MLSKTLTSKGFYIIEILIVIAIIVIAFTTLLGVVVFSLKIFTSIKEITTADVLAKEAIEAVRNFRDGTTWNINGLETLITGDDYYPRVDNSVSPPKWMLSGGTETINGFTRKIVFEKVSRDGDDDIEETYNPVNNDPDTRKITITVSWKDKKVEIVTYFTNWKQ